MDRIQPHLERTTFRLAQPYFWYTFTLASAMSFKYYYASDSKRLKSYFSKLFLQEEICFIYILFFSNNGSWKER